LSLNWKVVGLDGMTEYYDVKLKKDRNKILNENHNFYGYEGLIQDKKILEQIYKDHNPNIIIHLAAQAGVRYSINNPKSYVETNLLGTFYILELARNYGTDHLLMASTSSVYGSNTEMPYHENQPCDTPVSFYAATKKSNEVMAHSYSHLFNIPTTIFRIFTAYGSWGRPDMALFKFTKNILSGKPINVYNNGNMKRDFTHVYDLVKAISLLVSKTPQSIDNRKYLIKDDSLSNSAPYRIVNIGNSKPTNLLEFIRELERALGKNAKKNFIEMQDGDVKETQSNINLLEIITGFRPTISLQEGITEFVRWYKSYY
jgi:UDP-glucuronate 4-epimerase